MGVEPAEKDIMRRPPVSPAEGVFSRGAGAQTAWIGALIGGLGLVVGYWYYFGGHESWQTMIFTSLAFAQIGQALATRSRRESLFVIGLRSNPLMLGMAVCVLILQLLAIYLKPLAEVLRTTRINMADLWVIVVSFVAPIVVVEIVKAVWRRRN